MDDELQKAWAYARRMETALWKLQHENDELRRQAARLPLTLTDRGDMADGCVYSVTILDEEGDDS